MQEDGTMYQQAVTTKCDLNSLSLKIYAEDETTDGQAQKGLQPPRYNKIMP
jgi:hypothetical protein